MGMGWGVEARAGAQKVAMMDHALYIASLVELEYRAPPSVPPLARVIPLHHFAFHVRIVLLEPLAPCDRLCLRRVVGGVFGHGKRKSSRWMSGS